MHFYNNYTTATITGDTKIILPEPNFRAGIYKDLSGLYLYGYGENQGVSPNNTTSDANNRAITGWNPNSILYNSIPNWVGFLNYKSNNEVHFNNYLGNDNNGSRFTILSRNLTRTNKHFIAFNGAISGALNYYCGQVLLNDNTSVYRKAKGVIVIGEHPEITALGYTDSNRIWLVRKDGESLVVDDITESLRVRLQMETTQEVFNCFRNDDMFFISEDYPTSIKYPYILSDDAFEGLTGEENEIYNYLTVYTIDQNNYIRATGKQVIDMNSLKKSLLYLNKDNFNNIITNSLTTNNIIKSTDSDHIKFIKFVEFYSRPSGAVMGDSSSCHFMREENNIDVFLGGTQSGYPEIYPILNKANVTSVTATNLVNRFFTYLEEIALNILNMPSFVKPNVINLNDTNYTYFKNIIESRKQNITTFKKYLPSRNSEVISLLAQNITVDSDINTSISTIYLPNTINFTKILDITKIKFLDFKDSIFIGNWNSYPLSTMSGTDDTSFTEIGRSLETIGQETTIKTNNNNITYRINLNSFLSTYTPLSPQQIQTANQALPQNSIFKKIIQKQIYNNGTTNLNLIFTTKKTDGSEVPFLDYSILYQYNTLSTNENYQVGASSMISGYINNGSTILLIHDFYTSDDYSFLDYASYAVNSNTVELQFSSELANSYIFNFNLNFLNQGDILEIKIIDPFDSSNYLLTNIIKQTKDLTTTVSSYSLNENNLNYAAPSVTNFTTTETFTYKDPACTGVNLDADLNDDGIVNGVDLGIILSQWGSTNPNYILSGSNFVGGGDLAIVLGSWGNIQDVDFSPGTNCNEEITVSQNITIPFLDLIPEELTIDTNNTEIRPNIVNFFPNQTKPLTINQITVE